MKRLIKKHPLAIRWFHWIHFPLLCGMIWSGLMIYWASSQNPSSIVAVGSNAALSNGAYHIGFGQTTVFHFFPKGFWEWFAHRGEMFQLDQKLATGMAWHFFLMWFFAVNGVLYFIYTLLSGEWRYLVPRREDWLGALQVILHDLYLRKTQPPIIKYNPAQRIAYTMIVLMGGASLFTGLAIYRPAQFGWLTAVLGGYQMARFEHFWLAIGFVLFFVIHVLQVIRAGWNNFRSMVSGYEIQTVAEPVHENA